MCATCGCGNDDVHDLKELNHHHNHHHHKKIVDVEKDVLYENNLLAQRNRGYFEAKNILALKLSELAGFRKNIFVGKNINRFEK